MISAVMFTALRGLVNDRVYPNTFPQGSVPVWPSIRFVVLSQDAIEDITGTESVITDDVRLQIDVVAKTYGAAITLRDQAINALQNLDPPCVRVGGFEEFDSETTTHRCVLDYVFHPSSPIESP